MGNNPWDAATYDGSFGFVTAYGDDLLQLLAAQPGERVLDVGCGTAHHAGVLLNQGVSVVGIDADPSMLERARQLHPTGTFLAIDAQAFGLSDLQQDAAFDAAFSNAALHWMSDQDAVLLNIRRVLRDGARFVAEMGGQHNIATIDAALRDTLTELWLPTDAVPRNYFPTIGEQATRLHDAGFRVERMEWYRRPTPLGDGQTPADWTKHFRAAVWAEVPPTQHDALATGIDQRCEAGGLHTGEGWIADYCRLRFVAIAI